jgi:5-(carboxyamino)imidazole ribonucleotide synthase
LRAILGLPPGNTGTIIPAVMFNLTGEEHYMGNVIYTGVEDAMKLSGVNIHLYGKKITRPFRKMGHVTVIAPTLETATKLAVKVKNTIRVIGDQQIACD